MWCLSARGPSQPGPGFAVKWVPWSDVGACVTGSNALEASGSQWVAPGTQAMSGDTRLTGVTGFLAQAGRDQGSCSAPARAQDTQPQASASGETTAAARGQVPPLPGGATACRPPAALAPGVAWRASPSAIHASAPGMGLNAAAGTPSCSLPALCRVQLGAVRGPGHWSRARARTYYSRTRSLQTCASSFMVARTLLWGAPGLCPCAGPTSP